MHPTTMTMNDEQSPPEVVDTPTPAPRRVSLDLAIGLGVLGVAIAGKLLWAISDGTFLAALGTR